MKTPTEIKVCHFTSAHEANDIRIFHKECASLAEAGFEVYLVAANTQEKTLNGVRIVNAEAQKGGRFSRMLHTAKAVYEKALSLDADIYHFHDPELLRYALRLKRKGKIVIYDAHEDVPRQIMGKFWINKYLRKTVSVSFRTFENYIARRLDCVITATPHIRDRFLKLNKQAIDINNYPLLSELSDEQTNWENKANEICYIGGITVIRGVSIIIDALELLPDVRMNLAGKCSPASHEAELQAKPAWKQVNDYGFVNRKEVGEIMVRSRVGMVTLLPLPNHIDSQPNKMFEYMSAGIPVVGSDFPLWREILLKHNCGLCIDPQDPKAIAAAVAELLTNPEKAQQMGENGRRIVLERYNWEAEGKKLVDLYGRLLHKTI